MKEPYVHGHTRLQIYNPHGADDDLDDAQDEQRQDHEGRVDGVARRIGPARVTFDGEIVVV